MKWSTLY